MVLLAQIEPVCPVFSLCFGSSTEHMAAARTKSGYADRLPDLGLVKKPLNESPDFGKTSILSS
jgi:hypothetical protein